jgi:hypothetical protein
MPPRVPLAGGTQETLLSEVGPYLLALFSTADACALRLVCREFLAAVAEHPWEDRGTVIRGSTAAWRACFPHARVANVQQVAGPSRAGRRAPLTDADLAHLEGVRELNMAGCAGVTGGGLARLAGSLRVLDASQCTGLTDAAFAHLGGLEALDMSGCDQPAVTDAAIAHLRGIQRLSLARCAQRTITGAALAHLRGVRVLNLSLCPQFGDAHLAHLARVHTLVLEFCSQRHLTGAAFAHLGSLHTLALQFCHQRELSAAALLPLQGRVRALGLSATRRDLLASARSLRLPVFSRMVEPVGTVEYRCGRVAVPAEAPRLFDEALGGGGV